MECIDQTLTGSLTAAASNVTATIARNGDLIAGMHLEVVLSATGVTNATGGTYVNWTNNTGHAYIDTVELEIGGQRIDRQYGQAVGS